MTERKGDGPLFDGPSKLDYRERMRLDVARTARHLATLQEIRGRATLPPDEELAQLAAENGLRRKARR